MIINDNVYPPLSERIESRKADIKLMGDGRGKFLVLLAEDDRENDRLLRPPISDYGQAVRAYRDESNGFLEGQVLN